MVLWDFDNQAHDPLWKALAETVETMKTSGIEMASITALTVPNTQL